MPDIAEDFIYIYFTIANMKCHCIDTKPHGCSSFSAYSGDGPTLILRVVADSSNGRVVALSTYRKGLEYLSLKDSLLSATSARC